MVDSRRIIRFGKNSFVISIPKSWLNENKLSKGDSVYIDEMSPELRILPSERKQTAEIKKIVIETEGKNLDQIRSEIISAYLMNYNIIELVGNNINNSLTSIKNALRDLSGLEIMDLTSKRVTAHDMLNEEDVDLNNIVRRVDMIVRSMVTDSIRTLDSDLYPSINTRDVDVNRLVFLAFKVLRKAMKEPQFARKLGISNESIFNYWSILTELERIADQAKRSARHIRKMMLDEKSKKEFESLFTSIYDLYLDAMKAYYTKDRSVAFKIIEKCSKVNAECDEFVTEKQTVEAAHTIGFLKAMNGLIKHIARVVSVI